MNDPIKVWQKDGFTLTLWDTGRTKRHNSAAILRYELKDGEEVIFEGEEYCPSPLHSIDSPQAACDCLGFITLKPGDTSRDYFYGYTVRQMEWCTSQRCECLEMAALDYREKIEEDEKAYAL